MPGTTTEYGFPYPVGSDPLGDGDNEIQNLAEAVEAALAAMHQVVVKGANESVTNSATYQADDDLEFAVEANAVYLVDFVILWRANSAAVAGIKARWNLPSGDVRGWGRTEDASADGSLGGGESRTTVTPASPDPLLGASSTGFGTGALDTIALYGQHRIEIGATPGTAKVQWAQNNAHASTLTVVAGSWLRIQRVY